MTTQEMKEEYDEAVISSLPPERRTKEQQVRLEDIQHRVTERRKQRNGTLAERILRQKGVIR